MAVTRRELPAGYTQVEWIKSSGGAHINTAFNANNNTRVVMDAQLISASASVFLFGSRTASYTLSYAVLFPSGSGIRSDYNGSNIVLTALSPTERYMYDKNGPVCTAGGVSVTNTASTFQTTLPLYLFACNQGGKAQYAGDIQSWACLLYDNGTLARDYVPCINSSNAVGLYDMVYGEFYGNAGTGEFIAGPVVEAPVEPEPDSPPEETLEPPDSPANWTTPKTDWTAQDWFNVEDYRRITGNIRFLHAYAQTLWPAFELGGTVAVELGQIPTPNLHNRVEDDVQRLADNTFRLADFEDGKLFIINQPAWNWKDLNRIEGNLLRLYYMLTGQDRNRRRLAFELGGVQFG